MGVYDIDSWRVCECIIIDSGQVYECRHAMSFKVYHYWLTVNMCVYNYWLEASLLVYYYWLLASILVLYYWIAECVISDKAEIEKSGSTYRHTYEHNQFRVSLIFSINVIMTLKNFYVMFRYLPRFLTELLKKCW